MTREELIHHIQEGIKTEESAIAVYARHLSAIIGRSGLTEADVSRTRKTLEFLIEENRRHSRLLHSVLARIKGESIDVY
jgi:rubrerythrin